MSGEYAAPTHIELTKKDLRGPPRHAFKYEKLKTSKRVKKNLTGALCDFVVTDALCELMRRQSLNTCTLNKMVLSFQ